MNKAEARKIAERRVKAMTEEEREWASGCIVDALSGFGRFVSAKRPFIFLGTSLEPDTEELIGLALMLERNVCVPRVTSAGEMQAVGITPYTLFGRNRWGILEPKGGQPTRDVDVAVVPMVAFDGLMRVGHGGGYYDRFLASRDIYKIGVAFDCQQVDGVEFQPHDVPLDALVTQTRVLMLSDGKLSVHPNAYNILA